MRATEYKEQRGLYKIGKFSISFTEIKHLLTALLMITLTLMIAGRENANEIGIPEFIITYLVAVGSGFLLHELAHKFVAQYYGYLSEFRGDFKMMFFAMLIALTGFVLLAPGAVLIMGRPSKKKNGIISTAGPFINLLLAFLFIILTLTFTGFWGQVFLISFMVNVWLGLFNMIPVWVLDGKKILQWNNKVYFTMLTIFVIFLLSPAFL